MACGYMLTFFSFLGVPSNTPYQLVRIMKAALDNITDYPKCSDYKLKANGMHTRKIIPNRHN